MHAGIGPSRLGGASCLAQGQRSTSVDKHQVRRDRAPLGSSTADRTMQHAAFPVNLSRPPLHTRRAVAPSAADRSALSARARALQQAARSGTIRPLLRGKEFAVICEGTERDTAAAGRFQQAACELGAHVAHVSPGLTKESPLRDVRRTMQVLCRLYDAVICLGLAPTLVRRMRSEADIPVLSRLDAGLPAIARLVEQLDPAVPLKDRRRFVLQAVLLAAIE